MIIHLPFEILDNVLKFLDNKSICNLQTSSAYFNDIIKTDYIWKKKCILEYNCMLKPKKYNTYKEYYIYLYNNKCILCCKTSKRRHIFYNNIICFECQKNNIEYKTINLTRAKSYYSLTNKDIKFIPFKYTTSAIKMKLYLEKDIIKANKNKFSNKFDELLYQLKKETNREKNLENKHKNEMIIVCKFIELNLNFNEIDDTNNGLNLYTAGFYNSFLRLKSPNQETINKIVKLCLQYYFIQKYSLIYYSNNSDFDFIIILKLALLDISNSNNIDKIEFLEKMRNSYFSDEIKYVYKKYNDMFKRQFKVILLLQNEYDYYFINRERILYTNPSLSSNIYNYIYGFLDYTTTKELKNGIEEDILYYFFKYHTLISLINKNYFYKENVYECRKSAILLYLDHNSNLDNLDNTVKLCLKNYFKNELNITKFF